MNQTPPVNFVPAASKKNSKTTVIVIVAVSVAIVVTALLVFILAAASKYTFLSIQTDSMYPTFEPGDRIAIESCDTSELRPGDIITYWTVINGERVMNTHRIVNIYDGGGYLIFETQGDNNVMPDSLTVHESEIIGKYSFTVPFF